MAGRFSFSAPESRYGGTPWFRVGQVDVTTTVFVAGLCVLSMFAWAVNPAILEPLVLDPSKVLDGQVWRLVTWPLVNSIEIWTILTIAIFWYFGRELEGMLGRNRFAWFLGILTVVPAIVGTALDLPVFGLDYLELAIFLVFIAEFPFARFFFGIPGWVIAAVIVGLQFLQLSASRDGAGMLFLIVIILTAGITAKSFGLATKLPWIPALPLPGAGTSTGSKPKSSRSSRSSKSSRRGGSAGRRTTGRKVVEGPWTPPPPPPAAAQSAAQVELDGLLDKISASGLESLTSDEKRRLNELSKRLR